jgi:hypothetical protein
VTDVPRGFSKSFQVNSKTGFQIRPRQMLSTAFPIHYSLIIRTFDNKLIHLLTVSLNKDLAIVPSSQKAHGSLRKQIPYHAVFRYTTTNCGQQTVALYCGCRILVVVRRSSGRALYENCLWGTKCYLMKIGRKLRRNKIRNIKQRNAQFSV